ncbi:ATP-binding cassette domain-containing protein [Tissierella sp. Yu-01]|uniref:ATP-binding cassette domain-containing protein n=1 Tax=Tissierella sp. Yu-01 TaxID=3035694 RepID=UPI00240E77C0|nr:ATP-binding cassette domain-containing protein [Tissierella sp. Yu-01]WFA09098.1 ATP-binding cassette domain-containing protein [Tissierella sp. Yu-01]
MNIILKDITKAYDGEVVLNNINWEIEENKFNFLMGESGIGKTTLINILMGIVKPDSGHICGIEGRKISTVFQENRLLEDFDALTNLKLVTSKDTKDEEIINLLKNLGLGDSINKKVSQFSGGMKRRLAIGRALIYKSEIVIMDEPFKGLDKELYLKTIGYVKEKLKDKTVIIVTHREEECEIFEGKAMYLQ